MARPEVRAAANRTSAFPPIKDVMAIARRFNLNTAAAILAFLGATRLGVALSSGSALEPAPGAYEASLNALLLYSPVADRDHAVVSHDLVLRLRTVVSELTPYYMEDGTIVMLTAD